MASQNIIYALHHPQSAHVYVGKSSKGLVRPRQHSETASLNRYAHLPRTKWIKALLERDVEPQIVVLEECVTSSELDEAERFHIGYLRAIGASLLNCTDGGDGVVGHRHSDETRVRMSESRCRRLVGVDASATMSKLARTYWNSADAREKKRVERRGKKWSAETRAKMSAAHKGKPKSAAHRANLSAAAKLRGADPVYRQKQSEVQKVAQNRVDVRSKKSQATARSWRTDDYRERNLEGRGRRNNA